MKYALVADGGSDKVLLPVLTWSLKRHRITVEEQWADFSRIPRQANMEARLRTALELYPCDVLFVHRDSEGYDPEFRRNEIAIALERIQIRHIPVVPVRMTEAWLLANEPAIRCAAGNPRGTMLLDLPDLRRLEDLPDPKNVLYEALEAASGLSPRRLKRFRPQERMHYIPHYIDDYSYLEPLPAFNVLQKEIEAVARLS